MTLGKSLFKKLYKVHVYAGIFVAVHFAIFALSGLVLLFKDEIQGHEAPSAVELLDQKEIATAYGAILDDIRKKFPNDRPLALFPEDDNETVVNARVGIDGATKLRGARRLSFDLPSATELMEKPTAASGFFDWMLRLHREFFLGSNGKLYVGVVGLMYVFMLISGFIIYGNFMRGRSFGEIRTASIPKLVDLHKFVGMISFGWGLIVGLSGVFLAFNGVLIKLFQYRSLKHLSEQYQAFEGSVGADAPFTEVVASALKAKPDSVITYVSFPDTEFGIPGHFLFLVNGTDPLTERLSDLVVVNSKTAMLTEIVELPLYLKIVLLSEPLHFGDYGGVFLKVVWAFFTLCSLAVAMFGISSFFMKRRQRKQAAPRRSVVTVRPHSESVFKFLSQFPPYFLPAVLLVISIVGIISSLFLQGWLELLALGVLILPLAALMVIRRRDA